MTMSSLSHTATVKASAPPGVAATVQDVLARLASEHPPVEHDERTEVPVVYLEVPSRTSVSGLASATLFSMGSPFWNKGTRPQLTTQLMTVLRECSTRLVVLDEIKDGLKGAGFAAKG